MAGEINIMKKEIKIELSGNLKQCDNFLKYSNIDELFPIIKDELNIKDIAYDSRKAEKDIIFVAIRGEKVDGHSYIENAFNMGSRVFLVEYVPDKVMDSRIFDESLFIIIDNCREGLSRISDIFFNSPSESLKIIGVTGTKGKTTIANYIYSIIKHSGKACGIIGTNGIEYLDIKEKTQNTTPESYELHKVMRSMVDSGVKYLCMEVSSGGIKMKRVADVAFDIGLFINIAPDHLGPMEHPTYEDYLMSKAELMYMSDVAVINVDDKDIHKVANDSRDKIKNLRSFGVNKEADFKGSDIKINDKSGISFICTSSKESFEVFVSSLGTFTAYNALASIAACEELGIEKQDIVDGLRYAVVEGRMNIVDDLENIGIIVDYAHNKVSYLNLLDSIKDIERDRLIAVFGSVGERTKLRRKDLGELVNDHCQLAIITSENPGTEDPMKIIDEIASYIDENNCKIEKIVDRAEAIDRVIMLAKEGDLILITGRGHEDYNIVGSDKLSYPKDLELVRCSINKRLKRK